MGEKWRPDGAVNRWVVRDGPTKRLRYSETDFGKTIRGKRISFYSYV